MSSKKGSNIPVWLIVVGWISFWPAGLILTILKVVLSMDDEQAKKQAQQRYRQYGSIENKQSSGRQNAAGQPAQNYQYNYQYNQTGQNGAQNQQNAQGQANQSSRYSYQYQNNYQNRQFGTERPIQNAQNVQNTQNAQNAQNAAQHFNTINPSTRKKIGKSLPAILLTICGAVLAVSTLMLTANTLVGLFSSQGFSELLRDFVWSGMFAVSSASSFMLGNTFRQRNKLFQRYQTIIGSRESVYIPKLAVVMDVKYKKAVKDLQTMIDRGYFGSEAFIDMESHQLFMNAKAMPEAIVSPDEPVKVFETKSEASETDDAVTGVEGDEYKSILRQIREANIAIDDAEVSDKISRIEEITRVIFSHVEEYPAKQPKIRTFMNYYLPTTLKLLKSYSQIEKLDVNTENIKSARDNIEKILDMLVSGFEQQLDQLYETEEMDISSDINVLEQMMYKDGLTTDSEFNMPMPEDDLSYPAETRNVAPDANKDAADLLNTYTDDIADYFGEGGTAAARKPDDTDDK